MGPENSVGPLVAYIDGQPVELAERPVQFTVAHMEGEGIVPEWGDISVTVEVAADSLRAFMYHLELGVSVHLARIFKPALAHRYIHTKKKRTRKKYEKRIMAWFWEVLG